ncbi:hypothetical protein [Stigmatella erecta]|nr:hypothetical protein [Stigmatella erecta]
MPVPAEAQEPAGVPSPPAEPEEQLVFLVEVPAEPAAAPVEPAAVPAEPAAVPAEAPAVAPQPPVLARGTPLLTCEAGSQQGTYSPPLKLSPQDTVLRATGQFPSCVALDAGGPVSGQYTVSGAGPASCLSSSLATRSYITWSDGSTSTVEFGKGMDAKQGGEAVTVLVGLVIEGRYADSLAVGGFVLEAAPNALHCLSEGVASTSGLSFLKLIQQ